MHKVDFNERQPYIFAPGKYVCHFNVLRCKAGEVVEYEKNNFFFNFVLSFFFFLFFFTYIILAAHNNGFTSHFSVFLFNVYWDVQNMATCRVSYCPDSAFPG